MSWLEDSSIEVLPWQVEELRLAVPEQLFARLEALGIRLNEERFLGYAMECDTPEDLVDFLWTEESDHKRDQVYLLLFELWRRLLPEKFALSIFCDELDQLIYLYDRDQLDSEALEKPIRNLEDILDESVDKGQKPQAVFSLLQSYCAHDLEKFLYDCIADAIEAGDETSASELLDEFYTYVADTRPFDFLRARLLLATDLHEGNLMLQRILEQLQEKPDFDLLFEVAASLVTRGDPALFLQCVKILAPRLKKEGEFQQLLKLIGEYFCCLDKDHEYKTAQDLLEKRKTRLPEAPLVAADRAIVEQLLRA